MERKYLPTLGELIDRLSIIQIKELKIPNHKEEYANEIKDIVNDIDVILKEKMNKLSNNFNNGLLGGFPLSDDFVDKIYI